MTVIQMIQAESIDTTAGTSMSSGSYPIRQPTQASPIGQPAHAAPVDTVPVLGTGDLKNAVDTLNNFVKPAQQTVEFSIDKDSGHNVVKVIDTETNQVLIQLPNQSVVTIAKTLGKMQGLLIHQEA